MNLVLFTTSLSLSRMHFQIFEEKGKINLLLNFQQKHILDIWRDYLTGLVYTWKRGYPEKIKRYSIFEQFDVSVTGRTSNDFCLMLKQKWTRLLASSLCVACCKLDAHSIIRSELCSKHKLLWVSGRMRWCVLSEFVKKRDGENLQARLQPARVYAKILLCVYRWKNSMDYIQKSSSA